MARHLSAAELAARFEVSTRTIYRDIETLSAVGVPVFAEMGRAGGFRLLAGYFLPPVMLTTGEAVSLLLGMTLLRSLRATPFAAELETAEQKLLAAVPDHLRAMLMEARTIIGFERPPDDLFHPEPPDPQPARHIPDTARHVEGETVTHFLQAVLDRRTVLLDYHSPYGGRHDRFAAVPLGLFWDRDRWYLAGRRLAGAGPPGYGARIACGRLRRRRSTAAPATRLRCARPAWPRLAAPRDGRVAGGRRRDDPDHAPAGGPLAGGLVLSPCPL